MFKTKCLQNGEKILYQIAVSWLRVTQRKPVPANIRKTDRTNETRRPVKVLEHFLVFINARKQNADRFYV